MNCAVRAIEHKAVSDILIYYLFLRVDVQIETSPGAMDCWALLSSLEVLLACEHHGKDGLELSVLQTATLHDFTRQKVSNCLMLCIRH